MKCNNISIGLKHACDGTLIGWKWQIGWDKTFANLDVKSDLNG